MKADLVRTIIKDYKLNVVVKARTNGNVKAVSFDVDDLVFLNYLLKEKGCEFKAQLVGSSNEHYLLVKAGA